MSIPPPILTNLETQDWDEEWYPRSPRAFLKMARAAGWEARIGFSRGYVTGQAADSYEVRDVIGVWLNGYGRRAVMSWSRNPEAEFTAKKLEAGVKPDEIPSGMKWKPEGGSIMLGKGKSFPWLNATQMEEWTKLRGSVLPSWYDEVRTAYFTAQAAAKERAKTKAQEDKDRKAEAASAGAREEPGE